MDMPYATPGRPSEKSATSATALQAVHDGMTRAGMAARAPSPMPTAPSSAYAFAMYGIHSCPLTPHIPRPVTVLALALAILCLSLTQLIQDLLADDTQQC